MDVAGELFAGRSEGDGAVFGAVVEEFGADGVFEAADLGDEVGLFRAKGSGRFVEAGVSGCGQEAVDALFGKDLTWAIKTGVGWPVLDHSLRAPDRDLPLVCGDEICRVLVGQGCRFRVLMLTAASLADCVEGLGLSIVRVVAAAHNATLATSTRPGGGLVVEVSFPLLAKGGTSRALTS